MAKTDPTTGNTFGEEFAAQRRSGVKTFTWNGKEYSTDMASSDGPGRKPASSTDTMERTSGPGRKPTGVQPKATSLAPARAGDAEKLVSTSSNKRVNPKTLLVEEYKKGGSVRGWGQARGARKAKYV